MEIQFNSVQELYDRLLPALKCKARQIKENNYHMDHRDIWNYLKKTKWTRVHNLDLYDMVSDIMSITIEDLEDYVKSTYSSIKKNIILEDGELDEK